MRQTFKQLNEVIKGKYSKNSPFMQQVRAAMIVERVGQFLVNEFGQTVLERARPMYVRDKIINIASLSSVLAQEIRYREQKLIESINKEFGRGTVEKIRFIQ